LGEAIVVCNPELAEDFAFHVKQRGGMLAKGRLLGIQFQELFGVKDLFLENAKHANAMAANLAFGIVFSGYALEAETAKLQVKNTLKSDCVWLGRDQRPIAFRWHHCLY
jgi:threonine aldolase